MKLQYKSVKLVDPSVSDDGIIEAYVSVFGVPDYANEVVEYGAFAKSIARKLPKGIWHHDWSQPIAKTLEAREVPAGDPSLPESIRQFGGLYIKAQLVAGVQKADEARLLLKAQAIDEFSFGYFVNDAFHAGDGTLHLKDVTIYEWSPVLVGCNDQTVLVSVKSAVPFADHGTAPEDEAWDGPAQMSACGDDMAKLKSICAWWDPENADVKAGYKLPHHDAESMKAVWKGVAAAMGALLGARGGVSIPEADRQGVYNHLAKHYEQFGKTAPDFKMMTDEEGAVQVLSESKKETIRAAIRTLTGVLDAASEADNQVGVKGRTPPNTGGNKKIPVNVLNRALKSLLQIKKNN